MDSRARSQTQIVGVLPAIIHSFEQLDLAATIDRHVPCQGDVPLGALVEILIANRQLRYGPGPSSASGSGPRPPP